MNEFNKSEYSYLFGVLNSPKALRILYFLLEKEDKGATYAEIEKRPYQYSDVPAISVPELMRAGLVECFDSRGCQIPIMIDWNERNYVPKKNVCKPDVMVKASKFAQDLIEFLNKNSTSLAL